MPYSVTLPRANAALVDGRGFITREWLNFLTSLAGETNVTALAEALAALTTRVEELEQDDVGNFIIQGIGSISVAGTPQNGVVQISLYGDTSAPGVNYVYGTGPDGAKGWHRLYDAMEAGVGLVITDSGYVVLGEVATPGDLPGSGNSGEAWRVLDQAPGLYAWDGAAFTLDPAADGTVGFRLAELPDSGTGTLRGITRDAYGRVSGTTDATITGTAGQIEVANGDAASGPPTLSLADVPDAGGGTLQKTDFDAKGRKTGTSAATSDDLPEGAANLYYTDARVDARIEVAKADPDGIASLVDGKLDPGQLPALAITETFVVNTEAAMLALDCQQGDVAVRSDLQKSFILTSEPASTLSNWQELLTPADAVSSFNGRTGSVVPASGDYSPAQVGADPAGSAAAAQAAAQSYADGKIASTIIDGDTTHAPSGNSVFDALALKGNLSGGNTWTSAQVFTSVITVDYGGSTGFQIITTNNRNAVCRYAVNSGANNVYVGQGTADVFCIGNSSNLNSAANCWLRVSNGSTEHGSDNTGSSGGASARWTTVYAATGTINTSDAREKTPVSAMTPEEISAAAGLSREIGTYQWLASIADKGNTARRHAGITVQRAIEIMQAHGLDPFRYGFICFDEWDEQPEIVTEWPEERDEDGNVIRDAGSDVTQEYRPAGDRYSFRHDELLLFLARGFAARLDAAGL